MEILKEFLPLILSGVMMAIAVPLGKMAGSLLKRQIQNINNDIVRGMAEVGVRWASENLGKNMGLGTKKHKLVFDFIKKHAKVDDEIINQAIKAAVLTLRETREALGNGESSTIKS
jgi:hypothetical protein